MSSPRGRILTVTGVLAAPYGNLELRPRDRGDVTLLGQGGLPEPMTITSGDLGEGVEGQLVSLSGTISDIDRGVRRVDDDHDPRPRRPGPGRSSMPRSRDDGPELERDQSDPRHRHRRPARVTERRIGRPPRVAA